MGSAVAQARGLPFVPPAEPGELFGAWMLRVAEAYGITMGRLFVHLGVPPLEREHHPHWFVLHAGSLSWSRLAVALHRSESALCAMAAPRYQSDWPLELGGCAHCLAQSRAEGRVLTWQQGWMHVSTVVCEQHRSWLTPVTLGEMRNVRNERGLTELAQRVADREPVPIIDENEMLIDGAVWLQQFLQTPEAFDPPWGPVPLAVREQMVSIVVRILVPEHTREYAAASVPGANRGGWCNKDRVAELQPACRSDHRAYARLFASRSELRARQILAGLIGDFLRHSPTDRVKKYGRLPPMMIDKMSSSMGGWPLPAIAWICPTTAEFVRRCKELLARYKFSPTYMRERAAMLRALSENPQAPSA
jgi:hypothetical protein